MTRFMRKGKTKVFWVLTIASTSAPTAAEINAGVILHTQLEDISGFLFKNNPIDTPDMGQTLVTKVSGEDTLDDSSMGFYEDDTTNPISTALAKGTNGFVVIFYKGIAGASPAAADKAEVWPVQVASNARNYTTDNKAADYTVMFTNTAAPVQATLV